VRIVVLESLEADQLGVLRRQLLALGNALGQTETPIPAA
jgi:hypothetical protein